MQVIKSHSRSDGFIGDFCDGELYKSIPLFVNHVNSLQIVMFFDEMETCNPLSGHAGVHKLGNNFFQYTVHIFVYVYQFVCGRVILLCSWKYTLRIEVYTQGYSTHCLCNNNLNKYGFEKILNPFIEDVNTLSQVQIYNIYCCLFIHCLYRMESL